MDIKTADRLQELRKSQGLSQEALSEKLGVSRQAISKWERGESSPDTDNLIALANIYGITLDDIINCEKDIPLVSAITRDDFANESKNDGNTIENNVNNKNEGIYKTLGKSLFRFPFALILVGIYVVFNLFIHCWHPGWIMFLVIPIYYHFAASCFAKTKKGFLFAQPVPEIIVLLYLSFGFIMGIWGKGVVLFIIIPLYYWGIAFYKKSKKE